MTPYQSKILEKMKYRWDLIETPTGYKLRSFGGFDHAGHTIWRYETVRHPTIKALIAAGLVEYAEPENDGNPHLVVA